MAVTECQKYIQGGYNDPYIPAYASEETCKYYDSDFSNYTEEYKDFLQKYFLAQIEPYQNYGGIGWFFWTGKTLNNCAPEWDFLFLVENSILPLDLCAKTNFCAAWEHACWNKKIKYSTRYDGQSLEDKLLKWEKSWSCKSINIFDLFLLFVF